jgi:hypothetical protein
LLTHDQLGFRRRRTVRIMLHTHHSKPKTKCRRAGRRKQTNE